MTAPDISGMSDLKRRSGAVLLATGFIANVIAGFGMPGLAYGVSAVLILAFIVLNIGHASGIVKVFAVAAVLIFGAGYLSGSVTGSTVGQAAARVSFLSSILIALTFLRLVAQRDPAFTAAGAFLANQPPSRRYVSLGLGGNLFGVLLNLGGLGLLIDMTLAGQRRLEQTSEVSPHVHDIRERRIVTAIVRGFATIAFWSPFGIALNMLLLVFTDVHWRDAAPWGIGFALGFMALGGTMDVVERRLFPVLPKPLRVPVQPGDGRGLLMVLGHLAVLATLVIAVDTVVDLTFQQVLVMIVPFYALIWVCVRFGTTGPGRLAGDFVDSAPRSVNEIGVFVLAGLIGSLLVAIVPQQALDPLLETIVAWGGSVGLGLALVWVTLGLAMIGLHPIITVIVLAEFIVRTPLMSQQAAVFALLAGWTLTVCLAPFATTAIYVGAIVNRSPLQVSMIWNGVFGVVTLVVFSLVLSAGIHSGWF